MPSKSARPKDAVPRDIDQYIAGFPPQVRQVLKRVRKTIRRAAPRAEETISYRMPAYRQGRILIYFAAFERHLGIYPPVQNNKALEQAAAPYAGPKGNLKFPLDRPIPYDLIERIVRHRVQAEEARSGR